MTKETIIIYINVSDFKTLIIVGLFYARPRFGTEIAPMNALSCQQSHIHSPGLSRNIWYDWQRDKLVSERKTLHGHTNKKESLKPKQSRKPFADNCLY